MSIPTDPAADAFVAGGPRLAVSWVAPSGFEIGYIYSPLRPDLGLFIDHGLFAGWLWTRDRAVQPFARMSVSFACENHRDYYDQGHEYDTCSGPLALRAGGGVRLILQGPFAFTVEVVSGVALPSKVAGRAQLALGFDAIF